MQIHETLITKARANDRTISESEFAEIEKVAQIKTQEGDFRYFIVTRDDNMAFFLAIYDHLDQGLELMNNEFCTNIMCALGAMHVWLLNEYAEYGR